MSKRNAPQVRLGRAVKSVRHGRGLTQEQVSAGSGLHPTYISDIERGVRNPGWDAVTRLALGIGVSVQEIARRYEEQG
ncbi:MAG TPA: helix-turn-helix transcriptional regulator [Baekduia sp.]|uniref:helix-turn-helix domain-containing protein n=1 Tax=Baekduia sp. TaxID=2600305 RepID=UPI002C565A24|nr:helix-turn-helix transcriptional regulator [Baekduia sp.]HMJ35011.1 helix-turn-helix transcriptional regulator [Baekduia sp.]